MRRSLLLAVSVAVAALSVPSCVEAKLPAKCINRLISKSENQLNNIVSSAQENGRIENVYNHLKNSVVEFMQYKNGSWTRDCLSASPDNVAKYKHFLQTKAQPVLVMAMGRKNELCSAAAEDLINKSMIDIQEKLKTGNALPYIREFENRLKRNSMIVNCDPVKDRVASILTKELPNIKNNMKVGKHISALAWESANVKSIFEQSKKAFKNKTEAPLGTSQDLDFKNTLSGCLNDIKALDGHGYPADGLISSKGRHPVTFADARKPCEELNAYGVDKLLSEIRTNNENYKKAWKKAWEKKNILGTAMQRTYEENHTRLPAKTEDLGRQIIWTYQSYTSRAIFSKCKTYSFTKDGNKLLGLQIYACE
jgi:hypothetical protein